MTKKYEKQILNALLDKYERSKSFIGDNKVNQKFTIHLATAFPQYRDHSDFETFDALNDTIDLLARKELVNAKKTNSQVYTTIELNVSNLNAIYHHVGRQPKKDINSQVMVLLEKYKDKNDILQRFCEKQMERIRTNKKIEHFNNDMIDFENVLIAIEAVFKVSSETFVRDFSVEIYRDSKVFEKISNRVSAILMEYGDFPDEGHVLESLNLVKTPTYVNFKGAGLLGISGQIWDLSRLKGDIAISSAILADIERITITGDTVLTIENLTTFHSTYYTEALVIYLGGFHNAIRRNFIKKIAEQNPTVTFLHFGDIDAGGFYILEHLINKTGVAFKPFMMDIETLEKYSGSTKSLTDNDRKRLNRLKETRFSEVISYMLEHNCKLEQEAIKLR